MAVRRWVLKLWWRVGRRGVSLIFVGGLGLVLASSLLSVPPAQSSSPGYLVLETMAPLAVWAGAWLASTLICWVQAFMVQDRVAFAVASLMWWLYGVAYILGIFTGVNPRGWVLGLTWLAFGGWVNLIATWPESPEVLAWRAWRGK